MPLQQAVQIHAVHLGFARRFADVASGPLEQAFQIALLEFENQLFFCDAKRLFQIHLPWCGTAAGLRWQQRGARATLGGG